MFWWDMPEHDISKAAKKFEKRAERLARKMWEDGFYEGISYGYMDCEDTIGTLIAKERAQFPIDEDELVEIFGTSDVIEILTKHSLTEIERMLYPDGNLAEHDKEKRKIRRKQIENQRVNTNA